MSEVTVVYELSFPSTSLEWGPCPKYDGADWIIVYMYYEDHADSPSGIRLVTEELVFGEYVPSRMQTFLGPFIDGQWVKGAYDTVIDLGQTEWRDLARPRYRPSPDDRPLRHLAIYFDEGPCFECVCETFRVARRYGDEEPADDANPYDIPRIEET